MDELIKLDPTFTESGFKTKIDNIFVVGRNEKACYAPPNLFGCWNFFHQLHREQIVNVIPAGICLNHKPLIRSEFGFTRILDIFKFRHEFSVMKTIQIHF